MTEFADKYEALLLRRERSRRYVTLNRPEVKNALNPTLIEELKSVPLAQGHDEIFYPGEIEARNETKNRRDGLLLPEDTLADLAKAASAMKVPLELHD